MNNLICIYCGNYIIPDLYGNITCSKCNNEFKSTLNISHIYHYQQLDIPSLIEIGATKNNLKSKNAPNPKQMILWNKLLNKGLHAKNHGKYIKYSPEWAKPWLEPRFREYQIFKRLTHGIKLKDNNVLDVGAGTGFDSFNIVLEKAKITAFEYSPFLTEYGARNFPMFKWICGSASYLPFSNSSFDYIFCNQTLHHIINVKAALSEMLRIVKTKGTIFLISDSYCPSKDHDSFELEIFNDNFTVLGGINESIVDINIISKFFRKYRKYLNVEVLAYKSNSHLPQSSKLYNKFDNDEIITIDYYKNKNDILKYFDGLSFKITKNKSINPIQNKLIKSDIILNTHTLIKSLNDKSSFPLKLTNFLPKEYLNLNLIGKEHNKFFLLNGLQKPMKPYLWRKAFKRLRLFYSKDKARINYSVKSLTTHPQVISVSLNNKFYKKFIINDKWTPLSINLNGKNNTAIEFTLKDTDNKDQFFLITSIKAIILNQPIVFSVLSSLHKNGKK